MADIYFIKDIDTRIATVHNYLTNGLQTIRGGIAAVFTVFCELTFVLTTYLRRIDLFLFYLLTYTIVPIEQVGLLVILQFEFEFLEETSILGK